MSNKSWLLMFSFLGCSRETLTPTYLLRAPLSSSVHDYLAQNRNLIAEEKSNALWVDYQLRLDDNTQRDAVAKLAHENPMGPLCGQLLPSLTQISPTFGSYSAPLFDTTLSLTAVTTLIDKISADRLKSTIESLAAMKTRFHSSTSGQSAPTWIAAQLSGWTVTQKSHSSTSQTSVVAKWEAANASDSKRIVLGSHLDSINPSNQQSAPGADDNASGVAVLLEVAKVIASENATFGRSVELHFYAAEEVGLVGSDDLAKTYVDQNQQIAAMVQFDMTGFLNVNKTIHLVTNDTSSWLRRHVLDLGSVYFGEKWPETTLTAGTSDHRSWSSRSIHAVFPFEDPAAYNKALHTDADTLSLLSTDSVKKFTRLALAFVSHYAGLKSATATYTQEVASFNASRTNDIKAAVITNSGNTYLALATPENVASVEACPADASGICKSDRLLFTREQLRDGRSFFITNDATSITKGDLIAFKGYTETGGLLSKRQVTVE